MEIVKILGVDPSLRNTGLSVLTYNAEKPLTSSDAFRVTNCQVLTNPAKYTGTDAILNMCDMLQEESKKEYYHNVDYVIIESPPKMFNPKFSSSVVSLLAHVSGACIPIFGIEKAYMLQPAQWNGGRKKDVTHRYTQDFLGKWEDWHFEKMITHEKYAEHILDSVSMSFWWLKQNYLEE